MSHDVQGSTRADGLADVLERILDKGIVIAGDVSISLVGIELLTIRLRLLIATVDKAKEMGINWWESDPRLSANASLTDDATDSPLRLENAALLARIEALEQQITQPSASKMVTA
jgi:hypothetical protein